MLPVVNTKCRDFCGGRNGMIIPCQPESSDVFFRVTNLLSELVIAPSLDCKSPKRGVPFSNLLQWRRPSCLRPIYLSEVRAPHLVLLLAICRLGEEEGLLDAAEERRMQKDRYKVRVLEF